MVSKSWGKHQDDERKGKEEREREREGRKERKEKRRRGKERWGEDRRGEEGGRRKKMWGIRQYMTLKNSHISLGILKTTCMHGMYACPELCTFSEETQEHLKRSISDCEVLNKQEVKAKIE